MHVGVGCGAPAAARRRCEAEAPRHPTHGLGKSAPASNRRPARPFGVSPTAADTSGTSAPRSQVNGVATEFPRPGSEEPMAAPCVATGDRRPRYSAAPPSLPARWSALGARPKPRSSCIHPASVREPDRTHPPALLGTSSRQAHLIRILRTDRVDVAADANSSPDPRFVAFTEPRCRLVLVPPHRSKLRLGGGRHEQQVLALPIKAKSQTKTLVRCPDTLVAMLPPRSCTTSVKTLSSKSTGRANPNGVPRDRTNAAVRDRVL